jgi:hypothetical protein
MDGMMGEILLVIVLIAINGYFAAAEIALVSARRAALKMEAEEGSQRARSALRLTEDPSRLLAAIQVGADLLVDARLFSFCIFTAQKAPRYLRLMLYPARLDKCFIQFACKYGTATKSLIKDTCFLKCETSIYPKLVKDAKLFLGAGNLYKIGQPFSLAVEPWRLAAAVNAGNLVYGAKKNNQRQTNDGSRRENDGIRCLCFAGDAVRFSLHRRGGNPNRKRRAAAGIL